MLGLLLDLAPLKPPRHTYTIPSKRSPLNNESLAEGSSIHNTLNTFERTPVYVVVKSRREKLVELLLSDNRTSVNSATNLINTPFHAALVRGHWGIVQLSAHHRRLLHDMGGFGGLGSSICVLLVLRYWMI